MVHDSNNNNNKLTLIVHERRVELVDPLDLVHGDQHLNTHYYT